MSNYEEMISRIYGFIFRNNISLIIGIIVLILFIIYFVITKVDNKYIVLFSLVALASLIYVVTEFAVFTSDLKNESFIMYEGELEYTTMTSSTRGSSKDKVYLLNDNKIVLKSLHHPLDYGCYKGCVIYTERSKWVLTIVIERDVNSSKDLVSQP